MQRFIRAAFLFSKMKHIEIVKKVFEKYSRDFELIDNIIIKSLKRYSEKYRHYHNIEHIKKMLSEVENHKTEIENYNDLVLAIWFHDVVYNPLKKNNEHKSAVYAKKKLKKISVSEESVKHIAYMIERTAEHFKFSEKDTPETKLLLDLDLMSMGSPREIYMQNTENINKEYSIIPQKAFNKGRKAFLEKMLNVERLYRTEYFFNKYEKQARENIAYEISLLE